MRLFELHFTKKKKKIFENTSENLIRETFIIIKRFCILEITGENYFEIC